MRMGTVKIDYLNKTFVFDAGNIEAKAGDLVVIETDFGLDTGVLLEEIVEAAPKNGQQKPAHKIVRVTTPEDMEKIKGMAERELEARNVCVEEIQKAGLNMKLISARFSFDGSKVTFCYTAESRVDFRQLVRSLAARLRTRIELRQVGVRDEARLFGGVGQCGRRLCCATFLSGFEPVSIRMAKEQGLPLNPLKISGICGRLFCCLKYEFDYYHDVRGRMPQAGDRIERDGRKYMVLNVNPLGPSLYVEDEEGSRSTMEYEVDFDKPATHECGECPGCHHDDDGAADTDDVLPDPDAKPENK